MPTITGHDLRMLETVARWQGTKARLDAGDRLSDQDMDQFVADSEAMAHDMARRFPHLNYHPLLAIATSGGMRYGGSAKVEVHRGSASKNKPGDRPVDDGPAPENQADRPVDAYRDAMLEDAAKDKPPPKALAHRPDRGQLDAAAALLQARHPELTYEQLGKLLKCNWHSLRNTRRYWKLASVRRSLRAARHAYASRFASPEATSPATS